MALLDEEDGEHPRREWSPSMGHEERIPIQIKDKRDLRNNQGDDQLRGHGSCSTPENMFTPPRVGNQYPQDGPHTSNLPQSQGVENRERDPGSRGSSRHVKVESGGNHRGSTSSNSGAQPLAPVNPNCSNENNIDIIGVENGGQMVGAKGTGNGANRGQASHMRNQGANSVDCPIRNPLYKATCHPSAARFVVKRLVTLATCMCTYKCTHGKNPTVVVYAENAVAPLGGCRSTSVAIQEKNHSAARFVERASHRWPT